MSSLKVPICDRPGLFVALNSYLQKGRPSLEHIGLLLIDIKNFTSVNRIYDFKYGDLVLYFMSERLAQAAQAPDCFFRLGSDEFALLVPRLKSGGDFLAIANAVLEQLRKPFYWRDQEINVDVNIGCIALRADRATAEQLLTNAEHLLQRAKIENQPLCFATESQHESEDHLWQLQQDFLHALHHNELELVFQPKLNLKTDTPSSAEALLRWKHVVLDYVSPSFIVEMIARLGREFELTSWVLRSALKSLQTWPTCFGCNNVAVNIPANIVHHPEFRALVEDALTQFEIEPRQLTLEITESAIFADQKAGVNNLAYLKSRGIRISIDDFGTGFSSLQYFKTIPANELKIDQSFVLNMAENIGDRNIAQLIIDLAHKFGLSVVAEGVENLRVLQELKVLGCDAAQGFYIAKPMTSEAYGAWLRQFNVKVS